MRIKTHLHSRVVEASPEKGESSEKYTNCSFDDRVWSKGIKVTQYHSAVLFTGRLLPSKEAADGFLRSLSGLDNRVNLSKPHIPVESESLVVGKKVLFWLKLPNKET